MLRWEKLEHSAGGEGYGVLLRARVPGGWLVRISQTEGEAMTFYPDPDHKWNGESLS